MMNLNYDSAFARAVDLWFKSLWQVGNSGGSFVLE